MSTRSEKDKNKQIQDRCQNLLTQMLRDEDNKYCVDCDAKGPRWASWNIGIFLCIRCAGIHRNLGVHISKVKSVNLDSWTPEQVVSLQQMGNSRARAVYEANLPESFRRPQSDSALESFIRAKYEAKKYIAQEWVQPTLPKVNWDKELEEEAEKNRKKKRDVKTTAAISVPKKIDVIPQAIPKPHSSPKNREGKTSRSRGNSATNDLLALDTPTSENPSSEDVFTNFLSASSMTNQPTAISSGGTVGGGASASAGGDTIAQACQPPQPSEFGGATSGTQKKRSDEEESFFNQSLGPPANPTAAGGKLTTDSILALYSKGPQIPTVPNFGMGQPLVQPVGYGAPVGQPSMPMFNGQMSNAPIFAQANPQAAPNPFFNMQATQQHGFFAQPNTQIDLTSEFANLNVTPQPQGQFHTVSHQLWQ